MTAYAIVLAWAVIFFLRVLFGGGGGTVDTALLWALRLLAAAIAAQLLSSLVGLVKELFFAARRGEKIFTQGRVNRLLLGCLIIGAACRVWAGGAGGQGNAGWVGTAFVFFSLFGLGSVYIRRAQCRGEGISFWHPYWRATLVGAWASSLILLGTARPDGLAGGLLVALFWLSLIALVVQVLGRRLDRPHSHR